MPAGEAYISSSQLRVAVGAGAWNQVDIPAGARDALLTVDDETATWRLSTDNGIGLGAGTFVAAAVGLTFRGTAVAPVTVYVNPSAGTTIQVLYQTES